MDWKTGSAAPSLKRIFKLAAMPQSLNSCFMSEVARVRAQTCAPVEWGEGVFTAVI